MKKVLLVMVSVLLFNIGFCNNDGDKEEQVYYYYLQGVKADTGDKENVSIGDAIKYYYWSLVLCDSYSEGKTLLCTHQGGDVKLGDWLNYRIDELLQEITFIPKKKPVMKSKESVAYELMVTDGKDMVPWLKFEYNNGKKKVESEVESGMASVEFVDKGINKFDITICIDNMQEAEVHAKDVYEIMQQMKDPIHFASAKKQVSVKTAKEELDVDGYQDSMILTKLERTNNLVEDMAVDNANNEHYLKVMTVIEKALRNKDISEAKPFFTKEGYEMITTLLSNGRYYILGTPDYKFMSFKDIVICRSIPIQFNFNNNVGFIRHVVFRFDKKTRKVSSIAFRLSDVAEIDIMGKEKWNPDARMTLINFMEDYQTAYALKRQEYLERIFSDDALIIVGTVLKKDVKRDDFGRLTEETRVKYDTLSKEKYMENLRNVFKKNEYVNIRFLDTDFNKHKSGEEIYGIQVKQEYRASNYGDDGYLFLLVDLRDELPKIHIRTWEPEKTDKPINFDKIIIEMI